MEHASDLAILERIKLASGVTQDNELGVLLGLSKQSITKAKTTNSVPSSWVPKAAHLFNVSTDWLFFGRGPMRPSDAASGPQQAIEQPAVPARAVGQCPRCTELEKELDKKSQYIEEINKNLVEALQNSMLLTEKNGELRLENLKLTHQLDTARQMCREYAAKLDAAEPSLFVDPKNTSSIDPLHIR